MPIAHTPGLETLCVVQHIHSHEWLQVQTVSSLSSLGTKAAHSMIARQFSQPGQHWRYIDIRPHEVLMAHVCLQLWPGDPSIQRSGVHGPRILTRQVVGRPHRVCRRGIEPMSKYCKQVFVSCRSRLHHPDKLALPRAQDPWADRLVSKSITLA